MCKQTTAGPHGIYVLKSLETATEGWVSVCVIKKELVYPGRMFGFYAPLLVAATYWYTAAATYQNSV